MIQNTTKETPACVNEHTHTHAHTHTHTHTHTYICVELCNPHYCLSCTCPSRCKCQALNVNITHFWVINDYSEISCLMIALLQIITLVWRVQLHSALLLNMKTRCFIILANHCLALFQVQKVPNIIHYRNGTTTSPVLFLKTNFFISE